MAQFRKRECSNPCLRQPQCTCSVPAPSRAQSVLSLAKTGNLVLIPSGGGAGRQLSFRYLLHRCSAHTTCPKPWTDTGSVVRAGVELVTHPGLRPAPSGYGDSKDQADSLPRSTSPGSRLRELPRATRLGTEPWSMLWGLQSLSLVLSLSDYKVRPCYPRYLSHFLLFNADLKQELAGAWRFLKWYMQGITNKQKYASCNPSQTLRWWEGFTKQKF